MDQTNWVQMQQNPNPNSNPSLIHTANDSAGYSHSLVSNPRQPSSIESQNLLFAPQTHPVVVDPAYVPPLTYVPPPATVNYAPQPIGYEAQPSAGATAAAAAYYYTDPNVNWAPDISQIGTIHYAAGVNASNPTNQMQKRHPQKKGSKKTKIVQSEWCEVCKIDCSSKGVLDQHKLGKKHLKNLEKLKAQMASTSVPAVPIAASTSTPAIPIAASTSAPAIPIAASTSLQVSSEAAAPTIKPIIGPQENLEKSRQKSQKKAASHADDLETKKRRVLEGGADANSVRACSICNVVCNSDTVFKFHLAGQKHASMIKKHTSNAGVALAMRLVGC